MKAGRILCVLLVCLGATFAACVTTRDRPPKHDGVIGVDYHHCPKCHSLTGGIYGKGPNKQFKGERKENCVHQWEPVTREQFKALAAEYHGFDWSQEPAQFWAERTTVDDAGAVVIVKQDLAKRMGTEPIAEYSVKRSGDNFRVFVQFGSSFDENGNVTGFFPGGHSVYVVSPQGDIIDVMSGA